jgi:outer membrane protein
LVALLLLALFFPKGHVLAQDLGADIDLGQEMVQTGPGRGALGLGLGLAPDYEGSSDNQAVPLPFFQYRFDNNMSVMWAANRGTVNLIPDPQWHGGLALEFVPERDDVDNNKVDDLDDVDASFMIGGFLGWENEEWKFSIEAFTDIADGNEGSMIRFRGGYKIPTPRPWAVSINAYTTWADDDYMEAYFGIDQRNSLKSGLKTHKADSGLKDLGFSLPVLYSPWEQWSLMGVVALKRLLGDAKDSPVVDDEGDENQFVAGVLAIYRF